MSKQNKQLTEAYTSERTQIQALLKELNAKMQGHDDLCNKGGIHWGHHGDVAHIRHTLQNLLGHND